MALQRPETRRRDDSRETTGPPHWPDTAPACADGLRADPTRKPLARPAASSAATLRNGQARIGSISVSALCGALWSTRVRGMTRN